MGLMPWAWFDRTAKELLIEQELAVDGFATKRPSILRSAQPVRQSLLRRTRRISVPDATAPSDGGPALAGHHFEKAEILLRYEDRKLWRPLGLVVIEVFSARPRVWCRRAESNCGPADYESFC